MTNKKEIFYGRSEEIEMQRNELIIYILTFLTEETEESLTTSINDIEQITGIKLNLQQAMIIRQEGLKRVAEQEQKKFMKKR